MLDRLIRLSVVESLRNDLEHGSGSVACVIPLANPVPNPVGMGGSPRLHIACED